MLEIFIFTIYFKNVFVKHLKLILSSIPNIIRIIFKTMFFVLITNYIFVSIHIFILDISYKTFYPRQSKKLL